MSNKLNHEGIMLFEQPFVKVCCSFTMVGIPSQRANHDSIAFQVPYENYKKIFRTQQKNVEKDFTAIQSSSNDMLSKTRQGTLQSEDALKAIDGMIGRVENLKRKVCIPHTVLIEMQSFHHNHPVDRLAWTRRQTYTGCHTRTSTSPCDCGIVAELKSAWIFKMGGYATW